MPPKVVVLMCDIFVFFRNTDSSTRQLPRRPSDSTMDSYGNGSDEDSNQNLNMEHISTMTLDQFKLLLNNNLTVPNGTSDGDSPRSQESIDSLRNSYGRNGKKFNEVASRYKNWKNHGDSSKSFDSSVKEHRVTEDGYYELDRLPVNKNVPSVVGNMTRPKTPVSGVSRPKTPTSSVPRPKTPVSALSRPKTPVSSVPRPKTPSSVSRPTTPVSSTVRSKHSSVQSSGYGRQLVNSNSVDRPKTPAKLQFSRENSDSSLRQSTNSYRSASHNQSNSSLGSRENSSDSLSKTHTGSYFSYQRAAQETRGGSEPREVNKTAYKSSSDSLSSDTTHQANNQTSDPLGRERRSSAPYNTSGYNSESTESVLSKANSDFTDSLNRVYSEYSVRATLEKQKAEQTMTRSKSTNNQPFSNPPLVSKSVSSPHVTPKPRATSPSNIGYVSIVSHQEPKKETNDLFDNSHYSNSFQALQKLCSQRDSNPITGSETSLSIKSDSAKSLSSRQSSLSSIESSPNEERKTLMETLKSHKSEDDSEMCEMFMHSNNSEDNYSSRMDVQHSQDERKEEVTSARPSTPSMIPRPSTPSMIPRPGTPSRLPRPSTPLSSLRQSIDNLEQKYTAEGSIHEQQVNKPVPNNRPAAPRKTTILAKTPASTAKTPQSNGSSYTNIYLSKRSTTPGPSAAPRASVATPRRSRTPGPEGQSSLSNSISDSAITIQTREPRTPVKSKVLASSQAVQRRSRTPSADTRVKIEETVLTVDRSSGRHVITPADNKTETQKPPSPKPKILARSPAAVRAPSPSPADRGRSRTVIASANRTRPKSTNPDAINRISSGGESVLVVNRTGNGHVVNNRTEAWVEKVVKTTKVTTPVKKRLPPRRCKTPNPKDMLAYELESRPLEEIKAALTLPIDGLKELGTDTMEAPPEDPEMYAKMDELFNLMKQNELRQSVNETPGSHANHNGHMEGYTNGTDSVSLDSNDNVKKPRLTKAASLPSPAGSSRGSKPPTPTRTSSSFSPSPNRSAKPPLVRAGSVPASPSSRPPSRPSSTPPRPSTPTRSLSSSRQSSISNNSSTRESVSSENGSKRSSDHASSIVSKIKEMLKKTTPRKEKSEGPKSRIPAPKSLSSSGKSQSFTNLHFQNKLTEYKSSSSNKSSNSNLYRDYSYDDEINGELSNINSYHNDIDYSGMNGSLRSGTETPVPKLATPLTTGRSTVLSNQRELTRTPKLVRAVSVSSLSSSSNNTMSCTAGDDEEFV